MSFDDDARDHAPLMTTQLAERYRLHLIRLRFITRMCLEGKQETEMLEAIDDLADCLMAGGPTVVQVPLEVARERDGIAGLLDDSEPVTSSDRDHRGPEAA